LTVKAFAVASGAEGVSPQRNSSYPEYAPGLRSRRRRTIISQAGALVPRREYGPRRTRPSRPKRRRFTSFQSVAAEAGLSRIAAGVHTRLDHEAGRQLGFDVAAFVVRS
jgi:hypothetical protein